MRRNTLLIDADDTLWENNVFFENLIEDFITLVETYIVLTGGCIFLGFAAFRGTATFAENYLLYAFRTGTKLYLLYLLVGVGTGLARQWAALQFVPDTTVFAPSLAPHFQVLAGSLIFCLLVWKIPGGVASRLLCDQVREGGRVALEDLPLLSRNEGWQSLAAVKAGAVFATNGSAYYSRPGPRLVDGLELLGKMIHPEAFGGEMPSASSSR